MKSKFSNLAVLSAFSLALISTNAHAWFFFFIPGAVTGKIADAFTGAEGENCVGPNAKVGDRVHLNSGGVYQIKSLSGTSTRCTHPELPIRALLEPVPTAEVKSKAGISLPEGWEPQPINDAQKASGVFLSMIHRVNDLGLMVSTQKREGTTSALTVAQRRRATQERALKDAVYSNIKQVNGLAVPAWRYEIKGESKNTQLTYVATFLEAEDEIISLVAWTSTSNFEKQRDTLEQLAMSVSNLRARQVEPALATEPAPTPPLSSPSPSSLETPVTAPTPTTTTPTPTPTPAESSTAKKLRELHNLYKDGIIDKADFDAKKKVLINEM